MKVKAPNWVRQKQTLYMADTNSQISLTIGHTVTGHKYQTSLETGSKDGQFLILGENTQMYTEKRM